MCVFLPTVAFHSKPGKQGTEKQTANGNKITRGRVCNDELEEEQQTKKEGQKKKEKVIEPIVPISYYSTSGQHTSGQGEISSPHPHHPLIFFFFLRGAMIAALLFLLLQCHHLQARTQHRASCCYTPSYFKNNGGERNKLRQCTVVVARAPDALGSEPLFITTPLTGWMPCSSSEAFFPTRFSFFLKLFSRFVRPGSSPPSPSPPPFMLFDVRGDPPPSPLPPQLEGGGPTAPNLLLASLAARSCCSTSNGSPPPFTLSSMLPPPPPKLSKKKGRCKQAS